MQQVDFSMGIEKRDTVSEMHALLDLPINAIQKLGQRPPGLPTEVRQTAEWENLRKALFAGSMRFKQHLGFDMRELLTDAHMGRMAAYLMWKMLRPFAPQVLIGPGLGSTPLLYHLANQALDEGINLQILMVRDKRKEHNQKHWVEGNLVQARGQRAVFIDDFMAKGSAFDLVQRALADEKLEIDIRAVGLFFDMWNPEGSRQISVKHCPVVALFTRHDVGLSRDAFDALPPLMQGQMPPLLTASQPMWWRMALNKPHTEYQKKCVPVVDNDRVFVADDQSTMWCHDLHTGDVLWSLPSLQRPLKGIVQWLQCADDSVVYGCYDGTLSRVRQSDGYIVWRWRLDSHIHATPCLDLAHGRLFINTEQWNEGQLMGHVQCLDWQTGRLHWQFTHSWWSPCSVVYSDALNAVFAHCNDQSLVSLNADTGALLWRNGATGRALTDDSASLDARENQGLVRGRPTLVRLASGHALISATENGWLECVAADTGELIWRKRYGEGLEHQFLQVCASEQGGAISQVLVLDGKWHLMAFDTQTGQLRWLCRLRATGCWAPVPVDAAGRYWAVLSRNGELALIDVFAQVKLWEGGIKGKYFQPPTFYQDHLIAASNNSGLMVYKINPVYLNKGQR
jgi:outer membrane protein assembly factor BamB/orotate phosphoribosyltransferase